MIELSVKNLSSFLIIDVNRLPRGSAKRLAQLFDKLEPEARRLGGADSAENVYDSELAGELTGRTDMTPPRPEGAGFLCWGLGVLALWWGIIVFTSMIIGLGIYSGINPQTLKEIASSPKTPTLQGLKTQSYPALKGEAFRL